MWKVVRGNIGKTIFIMISFDFIDRFELNELLSKYDLFDNLDIKRIKEILN